MFIKFPCRLKTTVPFDIFYGRVKTSISVRIIPKLDMKGSSLIKGIHFEGLRGMGKPEDFLEQDTGMWRYLWLRDAQ